MKNADEQGLLAAIAAEPESDLLRLVYADWLEENGQAARTIIFWQACVRT